jgi:ligand-binding SRPBCC domain-containing protein
VRHPARRFQPYGTAWAPGDVRDQMRAISIETVIAAPIEECFDLARSIEAHVETSRFTSERVVEPGRLTGLLDEGDTVTFEAVHLGVRQTLTARVVEMRRPFRFVDEQIRGAFATLRHVHEFSSIHGATLMRDTITWKSPLGPAGRLADLLFLRRHLTSFLRRKQALLKELAETTAHTA